MVEIGSIIGFIVSLVFSGWLRTLEVSYLSLNAGKLQFLEETENKDVSKLMLLMEERSKILSALRTGSLFGAILFSLIGINFFFKNAGGLFPYAVEGKNVWLYYGTLVVVMLVLVMLARIFGELIPERIALRHSQKIIFSSVGSVKILYFLLRPFGAMTTWVSNAIVKPFGIDPHAIDAVVTEEEIRMLVDAGGNTGSIDENEKEMINNIFEFDNTSAGDIATHRTDLVAIPMDATMEDVMRIINEEKFSRIPVYEENIDNIIGVFHIRDMMKYLLKQKETGDTDFSLQSILMKPYFVPISKKTDELFEEMQKNKVHMAIVIDEYGGTEGVVTMEDILEEIVGNIFDEYDTEEEEEIRYVDADHFVVYGTTDLSDVEELLEVDFEDNEDYDTLGGYLIGQLGRIPEDGECPKIEIQGFSFQIEKVEEKRIEKVQISRLA